MMKNVEEKEEEETTATNNYNQSLSHDCLAKIFMYFPIMERIRLEQVCKKWKESSEYAWYDQKILNLCDKDFVAKHLANLPIVEEYCLKSILSRCGKYLRELQIDKTCASSIMPIVSEHCHLLTRLELSLKSYNENDFVDAFRDMKNLKSITIYKKSLEEINIELTDTTILESLPSHTIQEISIQSDNPFLSFGDKFARTLKKFTRLESLTLSNSQITNKVLQVIMKKETLIKLSLKSIEMPFRKFNLSRLKNIQHLNLDSVDEINDNIIMSIVENCEKLVYLNIDGCTASRKALKHLGELKNLKELIVNWVIEMNTAILTQFNNLKILDCCDCQDVADDGMKEILLNSPHLERLTVADTNVSFETINMACHLLKYRPEYPKLEIIVNNLLFLAFDEWDKLPACLIIKQKQPEKFY